MDAAAAKVLSISPFVTCASQSENGLVIAGQTSTAPRALLRANTAKAHMIAARVGGPFAAGADHVPRAVLISAQKGTAALHPFRHSRFLRIEGAAHTFGAAHPWTGSTPALDLAMKETVGWLSRHLL